jgi:anti-sigma B factor antagonist
MRPRRLFDLTVNSLGPGFVSSRATGARRRSVALIKEFYWTSRASRPLTPWAGSSSRRSIGMATRWSEASWLERSSTRSGGIPRPKIGRARNREPFMTSTLQPCTPFSILQLEGGLRTPIGPELSRSIRRLLARGERRILLDLAQVSDVDAAGVGELVRAFNTINAAGGILRITRARRRIRQLLRVAGVFRLLNGGATCAPLTFTPGASMRQAPPCSSSN